MKYTLKSHRNGRFLFENDPAFQTDWLLICEALRRNLRRGPDFCTSGGSG